MKRRFLMLLFAACALSASPVFAEPPAGQDGEIDAVLRLVEAGVSDDVIVKHIRASGFVFDLSADDLIDLRRDGVTDAVLEAMLDTALDGTNGRDRRQERDTARERSRDDGDSQVSVVMSGGWFSPWYYYPTAWGFYYDPFPVCYSYYYYPFRSCHSWGYYGYSSNYYYRNCWRPYRWWDRPSCYQTAVAHPGVRMRAPRTDVITWRTGRGLANDRPRPDAAPGYAPPHRSRLDASTVRRRAGRDAVHARPPEAPGSSVDSPRTPRREAPPVQAPRSAPRREGAPAPAPRQHLQPPPAQPRSAPPASAPRSGHVAPAPRSGGAPVAPRPGVGARSRLGP